MNKVFLDNLPKRNGCNNIDWKNSIGFKIKFIYNNIEDEFEIIDYIVKNTNPYLKVKYKTNEYTIASSSIKKCSLGRILGVSGNLNYIYNIGDIIKTKTGYIKIINKIRMKQYNYTVKGYEYECQNDKYIGTIREGNLINGRGCPVCSNKKVIKGINDVYTINPNLAYLLLNSKDAYMYTEYSNKKVDWKCPNCGNIIKNKSINNINQFGLSCPKCSDGISYPEKFMFNVLKQININFHYQKTFKWSKNRIYDFYITSLNCIIETHGVQHYKDTKISRGKGRSLKEEQENDKLKKELAIHNGIKEENYIVIDCRKSELEWIKNSIMNSRLNELFDLSKIDWLECHEFACSTRIKEACELWNNGIQDTLEISKLLKLGRNTITNYLKQGSKIGLCDYDAENVIALNNIRNGERNSKKIICLNNKQVFNSIIEAQNFFKIKGHNMCMACDGERNYAGVYNGDYLQWQYYDDYLICPKKLLTNKDIYKIHIKNHKSRKIICLNDRKIFYSIKEAGKYYNLKSNSGITECCTNKYKFAGKHPVTGEKLKWMYYEDYLKIHS